MNYLTVKEIQQVLDEKIPKDLVVPEHTSDGHFYRHVPTNLVFASVTTRCGILENPHLKKWSANLAVEYIDKNWSILNADNKEQIFKAAVHAHQQEFESAGDVGTQGHGIIELYLNEWMRTGVRPYSILSFINGEDSRLWAIARSAEMFCKDFDILPVASEKFVCSVRHRFAGTLDSLMMIRRVVEQGTKNCDSHDYYGGGGGTNPNARFCIKCNQVIVYELALVDFKTSNSIDKPEYAMQVSAYRKALKEMTGINVKHLLIVRFDKDRLKYEIMRVVNPTKAFRAFIAAGKIYDWLNDGEEKLAPMVEKNRIKIP